MRETEHTRNRVIHLINAIIWGTAIIIICGCVQACNAQTCDNPIQLGAEGTTGEICFDDSLWVSDPFTATCPDWGQTGTSFWIEVEVVGGLPFTILVDADTHYSFLPDGNPLYFHIHLMDDCEGETIFRVNWNPALYDDCTDLYYETNFPGEISVGWRSYYVDIFDLPQGTYYIWCGALGATYEVAQQIYGCFELSVFNQGFLDLSVNEVEKRKLVNQNGSLYILSGGNTYDLTGRLIGFE